MSGVRRISHTTLETIFGVAHLALGTNLALLIGSLPAVVLLVTTDPALSWPLLALVAPGCAPALLGAFTVFREHGFGPGGPGQHGSGQDGATDAGTGEGITRTFLRGVRQGWRPALGLGAMATGVVVVLLVDVRFFADAGGPAGALAVPVLGLLAVLAVATALLGLVALAEHPAARLRDVLRACLYLAVRRWYLTAFSLAVLAVQLAFGTLKPALAVGLTAAPLLYVVWANSRYCLTPVLAERPARAVTA